MQELYIRKRNIKSDICPTMNPRRGTDVTFTRGCELEVHSRRDSYNHQPKPAWSAEAQVACRQEVLADDDVHQLVGHDHNLAHLLAVNPLLYILQRQC